MQLLGHVHSLLELGTSQELKLELGDAKPVIHLKWTRRLSEHRRVRR
jgi:hypothetical protein